MHRTTLVLLLLAVKLPMTAEERAKVTVHQAEWGDTRGEAPPPSGPAVPVKASAEAPAFKKTNFSYGQGLRYGSNYSNWSTRYGLQFRYVLGTQLRRPFRQVTGSQFRMNRRYSGTGRMLRNGYRPNINYGASVERPFRRYGFSR